MLAWIPVWLPEQQESPLPDGQGACELGALGGTRTPNLLIRSKKGSSRSGRCCPYGPLAYHAANWAFQRCLRSSRLVVNNRVSKIGVARPI